MRRFTMMSITMLAGLVMAPACGAVLGIDTSREDGDPFATASSSSSGSSTSSSSSSSSSGGVAPDSGSPDDEPKGESCNALECAGILGTCNASNVCVRSCASCAGLPIECPAGQTCQLMCEGEGCKGVSCRGDGTCVIDCRNGTCDEARCTAAKCIFLCGPGSDCDKAGCPRENPSCEQQCFSAGTGGKKDAVSCGNKWVCCGEEDGPSSGCPTKSSPCDDG